jgi:hypothetical protein
MDDDEIAREHTFQPETAPRLPANKREQAKVDKWVEISRRRYETRTRMSGEERFRYTDAERQLRQRLLKAGLITDIKQPIVSPKKRAKIEAEIALSMAKHFADKGDLDAIQHVRAIEENRRQTAWVKRQRMLRRIEPRELLDAARDVMEKRGIRRSLASLWREFVDAWDQASPERQAGFLAAESGRLQTVLAMRCSAISQAEAASSCSWLACAGTFQTNFLFLKFGHDSGAWEGALPATQRYFIPEGRPLDNDLVQDRAEIAAHAAGSQLVDCSNSVGAAWLLDDTLLL